MVGWGLRSLEPNADGSWTHTNVMQNVTRVMDGFEQIYPGYQLLLTYDNAPSHVAKRKGALPTYGMNKSDGGKQLILTQMGWYDTVDAATGSSCKSTTTNVVFRTRWYICSKGSFTYM